MEAYIYEKIKEDLVMLRYLTSTDTEEEEAVNTVLEDLERLLPYLEKYGTDDEREVLGYAVGTAAALGREVLLFMPRQAKCRMPLRSSRRVRHRRMVNAFCDAVHNICELFTEDTWEKEAYYRTFLVPFRKRYGDVYFREVLYFFGVSAE